MITALNNRLRRRNSYGSPSTTTNALAGSSFPPNAAQPKIGPQRSSKTAQKLKLLPNPEIEGVEVDEESGRDVYSQYTRIKDPNARRDAARLGKADRSRLPRVTAYCTANNYQMDGLMRFLKGRGKTRGANPKRIDECIYTPYGYHPKRSQAGMRDRRHADAPQNPVDSGTGTAGGHERRHSTGEVGGIHREDLIDLRGEDGQGELGAGRNGSLLDPNLGDENALEHSVEDIDVQVHTPEVFLFEYGVVVIWGMPLAQEERFLKEISKFEVEKLAPDDVETEYFNFYYTQDYQARIYNDFIALRDKNNYMIKLAISHALAQSVKVSRALGAGE